MPAGRATELIRHLGTAHFVEVEGKIANTVVLFQAAAAMSKRNLEGASAPFRSFSGQLRPPRGIFTDEGHPFPIRRAQRWPEEVMS